jgi:hypothetical protein
MAIYWAAIITAHRRPLRPQAKRSRYNQCVCWFALAWRHPPMWVSWLLAFIHGTVNTRRLGFFFYVLYQVVPAGHNLPVTAIRPCVLHVLLEGRQSYFSSEVCLCVLKIAALFIPSSLANHARKRFWALMILHPKLMNRIHNNHPTSLLITQGFQLNQSSYSMNSTR